MSHQHDHDHTEPPADIELRVRALESLLQEKGLIDPAALDESLASYQEAPMEAFGGLQRMVNRGAAVDAVLINGRVAFQNNQFANDLGQARGYGEFLRSRG